MEDQQLFGVIALLMAAILVVGGFDVYERAHTASQIVTEIPAPSATSTPGAYTMQEIAKHDSISSCWTAVDRVVYDLTPFVNDHPGGPEAILSICGTDGTEAFTDQHGGQARPEDELAKLKIGTLAR